MTSRAQGFGFVEMRSQSEAEAAVETLNDTDLEGWNIMVTEAKPQENLGRSRAGGGYGVGGDYLNGW